MKAFLTLGNKILEGDKEKIDGSVQHHIFKTIQKVSLEECDCIFFVITHFDSNGYQPDFELLKRIASSDKPIIIVDYLEYGWDKQTPNHFFGINTIEYLHLFANKEYIHLCNFFKDNIDRITLYFKRELSLNSIETPFKVLPIDYTGIVRDFKTIPAIPFEEYERPQTFEEFKNRPIDILMIYGRSNPGREQLHGEIMKQAHTNGWNIITNPHTLVHPKAIGEIIDNAGNLIQKNIVALFYQQHFERLPIQSCFKLQQLAKITISLNGCGKKCFRHAEASYNSVMALQENGLRWAYEWGSLCFDRVMPHNNKEGDSIELPNYDSSHILNTERSVQILKSILDNPEHLYKIYLNGISNWKNYERKNYINNYFLKNIEEVLR